MKLLKLGCLGAALACAGAAAAQAPVRDAEANRAFVAYPKSSLEAGEQGAVRYRVRIDAGGRARECEVTQSSGYERLDRATCSMLMDAGRFTPSRDRRGKSRGSAYEGRVVWRIG